MANSSASLTGPARRLPFTARPFFENKARAFWILQAVGWSGYLLLRGVVSISNGLSLDGVIPVIVEAIVGYCITLLLSTMYGQYRQMNRLVGIFLTIATLAAATFLYAVLDAFTFSFIATATPGVTLTRLLGSVYVTFTVLFCRHCCCNPSSRTRSKTPSRRRRKAPKSASKCGSPGNACRSPYPIPVRA